MLASYQSRCDQSRDGDGDCPSFATWDVLGEFLPYIGFGIGAAFAYGALGDYFKARHDRLSQ